MVRVRGHSYMGSIAPNDLQSERYQFFFGYYKRRKNINGLKKVLEAAENMPERKSLEVLFTFDE